MNRRGFLGGLLGSFAGLLAHLAWPKSTNGNYSHESDLQLNVNWDVSYRVNNKYNTEICYSAYVTGSNLPDSKMVMPPGVLPGFKRISINCRTNKCGDLFYICIVDEEIGMPEPPAIAQPVLV